MSVTDQVELHEFTDFGVKFSFNVDNSGDIIQRHFVKGELYEREELEIIQRNATGCRVFYDMGSNVGNHALFMVKILEASKVYVFEANERAIKLLKLNIVSNGAEGRIDASHAGLGVGRGPGSLTVFNPQSNNLGAARLKKASDEKLGEEGYLSSVDIVTLDSLDLPVLPDFVKIDVEGMELEVLSGMAQTIARSRPKMFIEVNNANQEDFLTWVSENDYHILDTFSRYKSNMNYMIAPRS